MTRAALRALFAQFLDAPEAIVTVSPDAVWGEFTSNFPLQSAKVRGQSVEEIGQTARDRLGPYWSGRIGFERGRLQFFMSDEHFLLELERATREGAHYGVSNSLSGQRYLVEYVSSDPNGPLPLGAGRHAAWGEALCHLLEYAGARVSREFYLNDQTTSSKLRSLGERVVNAYSSAFGQNAGPSDAFSRALGGEWARRDGTKWLQSSSEERAEAATTFALERAVELQRTSLESFGTRFDSWVKESDLERDGHIPRAIAVLGERGLTYERDGALWLRTTQFGDDADRVLRRASGRATYFAGDVAYHIWKAERGFDRVFNVWGVGHKPYIARTKAALRAAGLDESKFEFLTVEEAALERDGVPIRLGLGGGPLVLDEEIQEIGSDALHWFFTAKPASKVATVDLEIATRDDESNPAYAAQLLPSRLATMRRQLEGQLSASASTEQGDWNAGERELARLVALWPDCVENAATERAPEKIADFVSQMARATRELSRNNAPSLAPTARRLELLRASGSVAASALKILGVDANERF
ncbi:arginine--tRNA ligase [Abditibacteriota bacterium]|nr:arginine--tRNA ligase [Abditibacteriota bacterium]